jgi:hypothetical protein
LELLGVALQHVQGAEAARACWQEALTIFTELGAPEADEVRARLESIRASQLPVEPSRKGLCSTTSRSALYGDSEKPPKS